LRARVARERVANVEVVEGSETDSHLPAGGVDLIFTCDAYHHLANRIGYFARLRSALRRDGRLVVLDNDRTTGIVARWVGHATPPAVMSRELATAGYRIVTTWEGLPGQTFVVLSAA